MPGRALILSQSPELVGPLGRQLSRLGEVHPVHHVGALRRALDLGPWDLVLCEDVALGASRGDAHALVHDAQPGVPLLVLPTPSGTGASGGLERLAVGLQRVALSHAGATDSDVRGLASLAWEAATAPRTEMRALYDHLRLASYLGGRRERNAAWRAAVGSPVVAAREVVDWVREQQDRGGAAPLTSVIESLSPTQDVSVPHRRLLEAVGQVVLFVLRAGCSGALLTVRTTDAGDGAWLEASSDAGTREPGPGPTLDSGLTAACEIVLGAGGTLVVEGVGGHVSVRAWFPACEEAWSEGPRAA